MKIFLISLFGVLGVLSRYFIDSLINNQQTNFPIATLTANLFGCFLAGIIYCLIFNKYPNQFLQPILIGFCGGLTTFSSYALQTTNLLTMDQFIKGFSYLIISPIMGIFFVFIGFQITLQVFFNQN